MLRIESRQEALHSCKRVYGKTNVAYWESGIKQKKRVRQQQSPSHFFKTGFSQSHLISKRSPHSGYQHTHTHYLLSLKVFQPTSPHSVFNWPLSIQFLCARVGYVTSLIFISPEGLSWFSQPHLFNISDWNCQKQKLAPAHSLL